jgi:hypothetical protein
MMSKKNAAERLYAHWTDKDGRTNIYNANPNSRSTKSDNHNANLFTGEAAILLRLANVMEKKHADDIKRALEGVKIEPGLFTRHPDGSQANADYDVVSHDEYNGIMYMIAALPELAHEADAIVEYGQKYNWQFIDGDPGKDGFKALVKNPIRSIKAIVNIYKAWKSDNKQKLNEARWAAGEISYLSYIRVPRDRAFYKIMAPSYKPSTFELLWLALSIFFMARKPKEEFSGRCMAMFRFLAIDMVGYQSKILNLAHGYMLGKFLQDYGQDFFEVILVNYFKNKTHPFHELAKGFSKQ